MLTRVFKSKFCAGAVVAAAVVTALPGAAFAQSFNGAGRINPAYPSGFQPNPNTYAGTPQGIMQNQRNNGYGVNSYSGFGTGISPYGVGMAPVYPFGNPYINPIARGNGFFGFNGGGISANLWRAPSGYYYPWYGLGGFNQVIYVDTSSGQNQTVAKDPPLSSMFSDMGAYLDDSKKNNKVSENDYQSLKRRLTDIHSKERSLRIAGGGELGEGDEGQIRQDLNNFSREMINRIKI